jgi:hypothetical protein
MGSGRDSTGDLDVGDSLVDLARVDRTADSVEERIEVDLGELHLVEAPAEPSGVFVLQPQPTLVEPVDLIDGVAKKEPTIPDRYPGLIRRHQLSVEARQFAHRLMVLARRRVTVESRVSSRGFRINPEASA